MHLKYLLPALFLPLTIAWTVIRISKEEQDLPYEPEITFGPGSSSPDGKEDVMTYVKVDKDMHVSTLEELFESAGVPKEKINDMVNEAKENAKKGGRSRKIRKIRMSTES